MQTANLVAASVLGGLALLLLGWVVSGQVGRSIREGNRKAFRVEIVEHEGEPHLFIPIEACHAEEKAYAITIAILGGALFVVYLALAGWFYPVEAFWAGGIVSALFLIYQSWEAYGLRSDPAVSLVYTKGELIGLFLLNVLIPIGSLSGALVGRKLSRLGSHPTASPQADPNASRRSTEQEDR